jgi:hypothetical protein
VLFEETFYNDMDDTYTVSCIEQPLSGCMCSRHCVRGFDRR